MGAPKNQHPPPPSIFRFLQCCAETVPGHSYSIQVQVIQIISDQEDTGGQQIWTPKLTKLPPPLPPPDRANIYLLFPERCRANRGPIISNQNPSHPVQSTPIPSHQTKRIGEISGSGRKVRPQKGGGVARAGHSRPPHWRGGAKAHGPRRRDFSFKLNRKFVKLGLRVRRVQLVQTHRTTLKCSFFFFLSSMGFSGNEGLLTRG